MSIGAYTFATDNWKEMQYPIDLWLSHNSHFFDELSVVYIGDKDKLPSDVPDNVIISFIDSADYNGWQLYTKYKQLAQDNLNTDWKVLLDSDEFMDGRIQTDNLDKNSIYALGYHHLYGNPNKEILNAYPPYYWRVHYGKKQVIRDGGSVEGQRKTYFRPHMYSGLRGTLYNLRKNGIRRMLYQPQIVGEVWHTNNLRTPAIMKAKWREQMKREQVSGKTPKLNKLHRNIVGDQDFSYSDISSMSAFRIIDANPPLDVKEYWEGMNNE
jgi:hypothetical protein